MNLEKATEVVLQYLIEHKRAKNSVLLSLINNDTELFEQVKEELIFEDKAEDKKGVGLLYIEDGKEQITESPKKAEPLRIFLSYGHDSNEELILKIRADLEKRGHDVWFDKNEIKYGDDWRRSITEGIVESNKVLSFLSQHSTRNPGVCLDEIGIALGAKGGNIQTILVENEAEVSPPASVSHMQWLDMQDWKDKKSKGNWEAWYSERFNEIVKVIESPENRRFSGEIEKLNTLLTPISSDARMASLLEKGFVGRKWLFDEIHEWNENKKESRAFWVVGEPGVGKSALAAEIVHRNKHNIIAAQFCEWNKPNHRDARQVIKSIAFQVATRLTDYRKYLLTLPELEKLDEKNESELFDYLLANPLCSVIDRGREKFLILIDALDEANEDGKNPLVEMLAREMIKLPTWIGFIFTSRPDSSVTAPMQWLKPKILDTKTENNQNDLCEYINIQLNKLLAERNDADTLTETILEKSEGVFLYVEQVCNDIKQGYLTLDSPNNFPSGVGGMYLQYFKRQFPEIETYRKSFRGILRVILSAFEPLPISLLQEVFQLEPENLRDITRNLGSLFPIFYDNDIEKIRPYHKTLIDWLTDQNKAGEYYVNIMEGHKLLADFSRSFFQENEETIKDYLNSVMRDFKTKISTGMEQILNYLVTNAPEHFYCLEQWEQLAAFIAKPENFVRLYDVAPGGLRKHISKIRTICNLKDLMMSQINWDNPYKVLFDYVGFYTRIGRFCQTYMPEEKELGVNSLKIITSLTEQMFGEEEAPTIRCYIDYGNILSSNREFEVAENFLLKANKISQKKFGYENNDTAESFSSLGTLYKSLGNYSDAEEAFRKALDVYQKIYGDNHMRTASAYYYLGSILSETNKFDEAKKYLLKSIELQENLYEPGHLNLSAVYNATGSFFSNISDYDQAEQYYTKSLNIKERNLGPEHPDVASCLYNLGVVYQNRKEYDQSEKLFKRSLLIDEKALGIDHPKCASNLTSLGHLFHLKGDLDQAKVFYEKALAVYGKTEANVSETATFYNNYGILLSAIDENEAAETYLLKSMEIIENIYGKQHVSVAKNKYNLGAFYNKIGDGDKALKTYSEALKIFEQILGEDNSFTLRTYDKIGELLRSYEEYDLAKNYFIKSLKIKEAIYGTNHIDTAETYLNIGFTYKLEGNLEEAEKFYLHCLSLKKQLFGDEHLEIAVLFNNLGILYKEQGKKPEALANLLNAQKLFFKFGHIQQVIQIFYNVAEIFVKESDFENAKLYYLNALKLTKEHLGENHAFIDMTLEKLELVENEILAATNTEKDEKKLPPSAPPPKEQQTILEKIHAGNTSNNTASSEKKTKQERVKQTLSRGYKFKKEGKLDEANNCFNSVIYMAKSIADLDSMQRAKGGQGLVFHSQKKYNDALTKYTEQEQICRNQNILSSLATCLLNQGNILIRMNNIKQSISKLNEAEKILLENVDNTNVLMITYYNLIDAHKRMGFIDEAKKFINKYENTLKSTNKTPPEIYVKLKEEVYKM